MSGPQTTREWAAPASPQLASRGLRRMQEIAQPTPARARLADLVGEAGEQGGPGIQVVLTPAARRVLEPARFSRQIEEGGFLLGRHYLDADDPGRDLLVVTEAVAARGAGSRFSFRFPGESFLQVASVVGQREPGTCLLGWYHTHVAPVIAGGGLSRIDVDLHRCVFRRPWQMAALVELDRACSPLRVFYLEAGTLREATVWAQAVPA